MADLERMPRELHRALAGEGFRRRRRQVLPLLTTDPEGFPRVALLTLAEVRANSSNELCVAVRAGSRTAFNLVRRGTATLLYLHRVLIASVQARAGHARVCETDPGRRLFPLRVERVRVDQADAAEGRVELLTGPTFGGAGAAGLFSDELFAELGKATSE